MLLTGIPDQKFVNLPTKQIIYWQRHLYNLEKLYSLCKAPAVELSSPCCVLELCWSIAAKSFCPCFLRTLSVSELQHLPPHTYPETNFMLLFIKSPLKQKKMLLTCPLVSELSLISRLSRFSFSCYLKLMVQLPSSYP